MDESIPFGPIMALGGTVAGAAAAVWALLKKKDAAVDELHASVRELLEALGEASAMVKVQHEMTRSSLTMAKHGCRNCPATDDAEAPPRCPLHGVISHMEASHERAEESD